MTFRKGQTGNPGGRPRGTVTLAGALRVALAVKDPETGRPYYEAIALKVIDLAKGGNLEAIKLAFDRVDGAVRPAEAAPAAPQSTGAINLLPNTPPKPENRVA